MNKQIQKANHRAVRQEFLCEAERNLSQTLWAKGYGQYLPGARPAQLRAGAKTLLDRTLAAIRREDRAQAAA
ncbi:MAG: hypothetical protein M3O02_11185 [Acidobacteriota bacterium]|nr:hypothetical protein [Acidobacteriota bacterium]